MSLCFFVPLFLGVLGISLYFSHLRYIVSGNEKQATFTGRQQRDGVAILPFVVAGLFGPAFEEEVAAAAAEVDAAEAAAGDAGYTADDEADAVKVPNNFTFDWGRYEAVGGNTPVHIAVTSMFSEYAVLYARIAGRTMSVVPPPMTLTEGLSIREQARDFVNNFVSPVLGHIHSTKMHKLLCHVADAIRYHGNIQNGNTASNESLHKKTKGVSSNGANRPKLQTWLNVAPFGQPGIGGWVELQNLGVTVQK